jgi:pyrroline-5-carboxylate reductase
VREPFGVIGLGRMAQAIVLPLLDSGLIDRGDIRAVVASAASAERLSGACGVPVSTDATQAWQAPAALLAVKPQHLEAVAATAAAIGPASPGREGVRQPLLISVVAGVTLARLEALFPGRCCVRAVPNTPCLVREGLTALSWGQGLEGERQEWVRGIFGRVGEVMDLPESQLDAFLALTSSGPAFLALVAEAMADGAVAMGLPRDLSHHLAHRTMAGTASLLRQKELHPGQLKDMVSSPAGTTMAGLRKLERAGLRSALIEAVVAAAERSRELA